MQALFTQIISQLNSSVFVLLGILVMSGYVLFKLGKWKERFFNQDKRLEKVEAIHIKVVELSTKVDLIYNNTNPRALVASHSPASLTEFGREFANIIGAEAIFDKYCQALVQSINAKCPPGTNAYDIQANSIVVAKSELPNMLNADEVNKFKQAAFEKGILYDDIWPIFAVYLRDKILKDRHIPVGEVDTHDPHSDS